MAEPWQSVVASRQSDPRIRRLQDEYNHVHSVYRAKVKWFHTTHDIAMDDDKCEAATAAERATRAGKIVDLCERARILLEYEETALATMSPVEISGAVFGDLISKNYFLEKKMLDDVAAYWNDEAAHLQATEAEPNQIAAHVSAVASKQLEEEKALEDAEIAKQELAPSETAEPGSLDALLADLRRQHDLISARYRTIVRPLYTTHAISERSLRAKIATHREIREAYFAEIYEQARTLLKENSVNVDVADGRTFADTTFENCIRKDVALEVEMLAEAKAYWRGVRGENESVEGKGKTSLQSQKGKTAPTPGEGRKLGGTAGGKCELAMAGGRLCAVGGNSMISREEATRLRTIDDVAMEQAAEMGLEVDLDSPREALRAEWKRRVIEGRLVRVAGKYGVVDDDELDEVKEKYLGPMLEYAGVGLG